MKNTGLIVIISSIVVGVCLLSGCGPQAVSQPAANVDITAAEESKPAEGTEEPSESEEKGQPTIVFKKTERNFNKISPGSNNLCEFEFENKGTALLTIKRIKKTCGCTPFELKKYKYEPGESGTIKVQYHASTNPGAVTRTIIVYSDDPDNEEVELLIKAEIVAKISYVPKRFKIALKNGETKCPEITIKSLDGKKFAITDFSATAQAIIAEFNPETEAEEFTLSPVIDVEKAKALRNGRIIVSLTHPEAENAVIFFEITAEFGTVPVTLILRDAKVGEAVKKELWVKNNYGEDFEIESVTSKSGYVEVLSQEKIGTKYKLELSITPPEPEINHVYFSDPLEIKIKGKPVIKIICRGFYPR